MAKHLFFMTASWTIFLQCQSAIVRLYEENSGNGESFNMTMQKNVTTCIDLPESWYSRASSVNTGNLCIILYAEIKCRGKDAGLYPGTDHGYLSKFGMDKKVKSLRVCPDTIERWTPILFFANNVLRGQGQRIENIFNCYNIEGELIDNIHEIFTSGHCYRYYSERHCLPDSILTVKQNKSLTRTNFPEIKRLRSVDRCPKKDNQRRGKPGFNPTAAIITVSSVAVLLLLVIVIGYLFQVRARRALYERVVELELKNEKLIQEFRDGNAAAFDLISFENADTVYRATNLPYDSERFEIPLSALKMDTSNPLGFGEFGLVVKATYMDIRQFSKPILVAVKAVKPGTDSGYVKALLDECKIMMYIQTTHHPHIVNLIGACTETLDKLEPYIILEYCNNGSLHEYLRKQRKSFFNLVVNNEIIFIEGPDKKIQKSVTNTNHLIKWSFQIADGMQYLSAKKVIHADLAARNVLLDENVNAKISDFGMARQLYQHANYVKKQQAPLPWRWMAIESLQDFTFSTQSDVWSFGVTVWEIFSLAKVPYPGTTWTDQFIQNLKAGYRMPKPKYATLEIYNLMLKCWNSSSICRPTFEDLRNQFSTMLAQE